MFDNFLADITEKYIANQDLILILILILIFVVIYSLLAYVNLFKDNKKINALISVCIAFMSVFFMKESWIIYTYILPFKTIALILFFIIPLLIILIIAHKNHMSAVGRKSLLIIFLIIQVFITFKDSTTFSFETNESKYILVGITLLLILLDTPVNKLIKTLK